MEEDPELGSRAASASSQRLTAAGSTSATPSKSNQAGSVVSHNSASSTASANKKMDDPGHPAGESSSSSEEGVGELFEKVLTKGVERLVTDTGVARYFAHLDTRVFLRRLAGSLLPRSWETKGATDPLKKPDFYGPLVLAFCLASELHFLLKKEETPYLHNALHKEAEGSTHMDTALLVCFGSLVLGSLVLDVAWQYVVGSSAASASNVSLEAASGTSTYSLGLDRALCVVGYSFFGPCIVLFFALLGLPRFLFVLFALVPAIGSASCLGLIVHRATGSRFPGLGLGAAIVHMLWVYCISRL